MLAVIYSLLHSVCILQADNKLLPDNISIVGKIKYLT